MDIQVNKDNICINKLVCEKKELIFVEEDMIVPDSKPDVLNTINMTGNVCVYKKEVMDGKIKIDGCVNTYIMYLPDSQNEHLRGLNASLDFSQVIQVQDVKEGMNVVGDVNIKSLECKVLNGRKINVRAGLEINMKVYSNEDIEIINKIDNISNIQTLEKEIQLNSLVGNSSTRIYVKDTINIDEQDEVLEILKSEINLVDNDIKISYNKILSKCEVEVKIMYLTQDGRIKNCSGKIPAVGFIDMQNVSEENICDVNTEIKNIQIKPNQSEEHSIYIEIELESSCKAYEKKNIQIIQDLYSPLMDLNFTQKKINTLSEKSIKTKDFTITSKTSIADLLDGNLLDVETSCVLNKQEITNSKIIFEGDILLNFIFEKNENSINSKITKIPFDFSIDNPMSTQMINVENKVMILGKRFDVRSGGDIECNIDLEFITEFSQNITINIIDNIDVEENRKSDEDYDSLILYIVEPGDSLWKIAKKFRSTIKDIATLNGIQDIDKINVGQKIYIPKFNYMNRE